MAAKRNNESDVRVVWKSGRSCDQVLFVRTCKMSHIPARNPASGQAMKIRIKIQMMLKQPFRPLIVNLFSVAKRHFVELGRRFVRLAYFLLCSQFGVSPRHSRIDNCHTSGNGRLSNFWKKASRSRTNHFFLSMSNQHDRAIYINTVWGEPWGNSEDDSPHWTEDVSTICSSAWRVVYICAK